MTPPRPPVLLKGTTIADPDTDRGREPVLIGPDGRICAVGKEQVRADPMVGEALVVEVGGFLAPGLINMHTHLGLALPGAMSQAVDTRDDAAMVLMMADAAARTLHGGITTARLVGESRYLDVTLRAAIERGALPGPRIFTACHALCCTGGHGWDADALEADGADGFTRAVRTQIRAGADLIKVCISGGIAGEHEEIDTPQLSDGEMAAVITTAHAWGKQVTAHAGSSSTVRRAVDLGLDGVEHGYSLDEETTALMAARGTWYCPTISVSRCREFFELNQVPSWLMERALGAGPEHWASLQRAISAGVPIVMGSDMPPYAPFDGTTATTREMEFMEEAGMSPTDVLRSATSRAAQWLGVDDRGVIAPGAWADLILLDEDPRDGIGALRTLHAVIKGGHVVRDDRHLLTVWPR